MGTTTTTVKESVTKIQKTVPEWWDVPVMMVIFAGLFILAENYAPSARQFPVTFLGAGLFFLAIELLSEILPGEYGRRLKSLTEGMASDFDMELDDEMKEAEDEDESDKYNPIKDNRAKVIVLAVDIAVMFVAAYFVTFLLAVPIFAAVTVWTVGSGKVSHFVIITLILMISVYFLFGQIMNVPIMEGAWISL